MKKVDEWGGIINAVATGKIQEAVSHQAYQREKAVQEGKVMKLVFLKDLTAAGFKCSSCSFLTVQTIKSCPYCGGKFEGVNYLIDYTAQKAVEQGALIEIITKSDELVKAGGIGAFLRF